MTNPEYQREIRAIKLLQERTAGIEDQQKEIFSDLEDIKKKLGGLGLGELKDTDEYAVLKRSQLERMSSPSPIHVPSPEAVFIEAERRFQGDEFAIHDILSADDFLKLDARLNEQIARFNKKYSLDEWDYAIAGACGLFAALLDILCVKAPPKPTVDWSNKVDGIFNQWVQNAFNTLLPEDVSKVLSSKFVIGAPDSSVITQLIGAPAKVINPINHRLKSLAHDPILGFIFGVWDMLNGTCTVVVDGEIRSFPSVAGATNTSDNIFQLIGRHFGHLLSDVNAPSANGNRGMGLPAPFMGILRMLEGVPVGESNFGKQIEWMYVKGYDFRQFVVTSVPMAIMEILCRALYAIKQHSMGTQTFAEAIVDTIPLKMNPRFRVLLAMAYTTSTSINAGKMYVTQNILNANYASWMGVIWNGFHALKWELYGRQMKFWSEVEAEEIRELENIVKGMDSLIERAEQLPY
jgi:hypothetical protein